MVCRAGALGSGDGCGLGSGDGADEGTAVAEGAGAAAVGLALGRDAPGEPVGRAAGVPGRPVVLPSTCGTDVSDGDGVDRTALRSTTGV
ncbi:MAG TPA: hypothetical protein VGD72_14725 [Mycobacteriales bacterium]